MKKALIFDTQHIASDHFKKSLPYLPGLLVKQVTRVSCMKKFQEKLSSSLWDIILINFQIDAVVKILKIKHWITVIKLNQGPSLQLIGIPLNSGQEKLLKKLGVQVTNFVYDLRVFTSETPIPLVPSTTIENIQKLVCEYYKLPYDLILEPITKDKIVLPRQITMYLARKYTKNTLKKIGYHFKGKDHTTVIHSCQIIKDRMGTDLPFREVVLGFERRILSSL